VCVLLGCVQRAASFTEQLSENQCYYLHWTHYKPTYLWNKY